MAPSGDRKPDEFMVADAVEVEPVSVLTFPANREINRDDDKFAQI
jgi:hypothetical protein